jgi:hypothetical protein
MYQQIRPWTKVEGVEDLETEWAETAETGEEPEVVTKMRATIELLEIGDPDRLPCYGMMTGNGVVVTVMNLPGIGVVIEEEVQFYLVFT